MLCSAEPITRRCSYCWNANAAVIALVAISAITVVRIIPTSAADPPPPITGSQDQQIPSATTENRMPDPIIGTWKGEHGVILNLRADGTARNRSADDKININYYEYQRRDKQLVFYYSAEPDEYWRQLMQAIFGATAERFDLARLSKTELEVLDPATGDTYVFTRTEDPVLVDSP